MQHEPLYSGDAFWARCVWIEIPRIPIPWKWQRWNEVSAGEREKFEKEATLHWKEQRKLFPKEGEDLVELFWYGRKVRALILRFISCDVGWRQVFTQHRPIPIHARVHFEFSEFIQKAIIYGNYRNKVKLDKKVKQ